MHGMRMDRARFEDLVADALDDIPAGLMDLVDNVVFLVEDESPPGQPELLGLYEGVPLTERGAGAAGMLPDRITIFAGPTLRMCRSEAEVRHQVGVTVVHEIAHYFGIDDARLHELGWD